VKDDELSLPGELEKYRQMGDNEIQGAFICSRETFINLYKLEKRRSLREDIPRCLAHFNITGDFDSQQIREIENQLLETISRELRTGDLACRWKESHIVLLLPGTSAENARKVLKRLEKNFFQQFDLNGVKLEKQVQSVAELT